MKRIIVAGGLGSLGRAIIARLAEEGAAIVAVDLAIGDCAHARKVIGGVDLSDRGAVEQAYAEGARELGGVDGLVNVAGGFVWETLEDGSEDSWDQMYRMNVRSAAVSSKAILEHLAKGGAIVNVGAAAAAKVDSGMAPYAASKAGVMALTEGLAEELRSRSIRVNAILPTILDTPANRKDMPDADTSGWVRLEGAANVVAFLLSDQAGSISGAGIRLSLPG